MVLLKGQFRKLEKLLRLLPRREYRNALRLGVAAGIEHAHIIRSLNTNLVFDVGANVGQFSLVVRKEHPHAQIVAFEPLAKAAGTYRKLFADDDKVLLHQVALGPKRKQVEMYVSKRLDSSSLLPISSIQTDLFPGTGEAGREIVTIAPLLDFIDGEKLVSPALLKIDVQGFELEVLKSAEDFLKYFQWIYVEASFKEFYEGQPLVWKLITFLQGQGFFLEGINDPFCGGAGQVLQADFLFTKSD